MSVRQFVTPAGTTITIGATNPTLLRLRDTCFRGAQKPLAGNFINWQNLFDIFDDVEFMPLFLAEVDRAIANIPGDRFHQKYFSVEAPAPVGWSSTAPCQDFTPSETEDFAPNGHCVGRRVKEEVGRLAPFTNVVTFSADFMKLSCHWSLVIYTVYPGACIGPLRRAATGGRSTSPSAKEWCSSLSRTEVSRSSNSNYHYRSHLSEGTILNAPALSLGCFSFSRLETKKDEVAPHRFFALGGLTLIGFSVVSSQWTLKNMEVGMKKKVLEDFIMVTPRNVRLIAYLLTEKRGHLLIAEPGHASYGEKIVDVVMQWYDHPTLDRYKRQWSLSTPRGTRNGWQTGWKNDREWILRPVRSPSDDAGVELARSLFEKEVVGKGYEFKIGFLATSGRGLPRREGVVIYVPRTRGSARKQQCATSALLCALRHYVDLINGKQSPAKRPFAGDEAAKLATYAAQDLIDGKVFHGNVDAGEEADAICC